MQNDDLRPLRQKGQVLFLSALAGLTLLLAPLTGHSADTKRIIVLETMPVAAVVEQSRHFRHHLERMATEDGIPLEVVLLKAGGDRTRAERLLQEAVSGAPPDLVVAVATMAAQAAVARLGGTKTPILFLCVSDPVGAFIVEAVGVPTGTNITGRVYTVSRRSKIRMVMRLVEQRKGSHPIRFGFIHSSYPSAVGDIEALQNIARERADVTFVAHQLPYRQVPDGLPAMLADVKKAIEALADPVDYWWEPSGPLGETTEYTRTLLAESEHAIAFGTKLSSVEMGALLHVTPDWEASGRETAAIARAILNGADPGSIPVTPPETFLLGLNLTTALKLGLVIPPDLMQLAGPHVYR
jgi:putative ABC transport system substrate-binding protein